MHSIHMTYSMHIQCVCLIIRLTPFPNSDLFFPRVESQTASLLLPLDKFYQHAFSSFALAETCQKKKKKKIKFKKKIGQGRAAAQEEKKKKKKYSLTSEFFKGNGF